MKADIHIPKEILVNIDYTNTVNGGMSVPTVDVKKAEDGYRLSLKVPGLKAEDFQVDMVNNRLLLYHLLPIFAERISDYENARTLRVLANMYVPSDVDHERISARFDEESKLLNVLLPYNDIAQDFRRHIDIE